MAMSEKRRKYLAGWRERNRERVNKKQREWAKEHRKNNLEEVRSNDRKQHQKYKEKRNKYSSEYHKAHKDDIAFKESRNKRTLRYYYGNKEKASARSKLGKAVLRGQMEKKTNCECCGQQKELEGHHPDHRKPLEVIWLCKKCHVFLEKACDDWEKYLSEIFADDLVYVKDLPSEVEIGTIIQNAIFEGADLAKAIHKRIINDEIRNNSVAVA